MRKTLNDIYDWKNSEGIFYYLTANFNVPWVDEVDGLILDYDYYGNRSGDKFISSLLENLYDEDEEEISTADKEKIATLIYKKYGNAWHKMWEVLTAEYEPLENYDRTDQYSGSDTQTEIPENWTETSVSELADNGTNSTNNVYAFNGTDAVPVSSDSTNSKGKVERTQAGEYERTTEYGQGFRSHGNIGVMTTQQMIKSELDLRQEEVFFDKVFSDVDKIICVNVFKRW